MKTRAGVSSVSDASLRQLFMMKRSALLLFFIVLAGSALGDIEKRLINGHKCGPTEGRHHVALTVLDNNGQPSINDIRCGGSLIGSDWVITAAHCDHEKLVTLLGTHPNKLNIRGNIAEKHQYKDCDGPHDILLLKVTYQKPTPPLPTISLPTFINCRTPTQGTPVEVFGRFTAFLIPQVTSSPLKGKSVQLRVLQCGQMKISNCEDMTQYRNHLNMKLRQFYYNWRVCAMDLTNQRVDSCEGNSGGSLVVNNTLYGVLSSGPNRLCDGPVDFMDVCRYRTWIHDVTGL